MTDSYYAESTTEGLVRRAQSGDRACLDLLWRQHRRYAAAILVAHGARASDDLEDLLQEVAMIVLRRIGDVESPAAFRGWLRTVALNLLRSRRRRQSTRPAPVALESVEGGVALATTDHHAEAIDHSDENRAILAALAELPEDQREVLVLRSLEGVSQREIARRLDLPETTIESRLARARRNLRDVLRRRRSLFPEEPR